MLKKIVLHLAVFAASCLIFIQPARATLILGPYQSQLFGDASLAISPAVTLQAAAVGGETWIGSLVTIWYNWTVTGPTAGEHVKVMIDWSASVSAFAGDDHSDARASATVDFRTPLEQVAITTTCAVPGGGSCSKTAGSTISLVGAVDYVHSVSLDLNVSAMQSAYAFGYIDPKFFIDPSQPNAELYSILVSDGVSNERPVAGTVPEPASLGLLAFGLMMALSRRRSVTAIRG
jgi:hypothetical protein